jgi:hypothetical protein
MKLKINNLFLLKKLLFGKDKFMHLQFYFKAIQKIKIKNTV